MNTHEGDAVDPGPSATLWTRGFIRSLATNLFVSMVFYLLMTTMALFAIDRFQASDSTAGLTSSAFIIGSIVARVFTGKYLDIVGRRRMLLLSLIAFLVATVLYIPVDNLGVLIALRAVHGVAFGVGTSAIAASAMALIPTARRSEGTGYFSISTTLSMAVGPFISALLLAEFGYTSLFVFSTASSVMALIVALGLRLPEYTPTAEEYAARWKLRFSDVLERAALPIASVTLMVSVSYSGVLIFFSTYARENDLGAVAAPFFLVYAVSVLATRLFAGRIQDRRGDNIIMYPAILGFAAGLALLGAAQTVPVVLVSAAVLGMGFGAALPAAQAISVTEAGLPRVAVAVSTHFLALDVGLGLGPILLGVIVGITGYSGLYLLLAAVTALGVLLYHFVHGYKRARLR
jgi:MFS family permease